MVSCLTVQGGKISPLEQEDDRGGDRSGAVERRSEAAVANAIRGAVGLTVKTALRVRFEPQGLDPLRRCHEPCPPPPAAAFIMTG